MCVRMLAALACSAYLIRDVVDEMSLNGVRPDKFVLQTGELLGRGHATALRGTGACTDSR